MRFLLLSILACSALGSVLAGTSATFSASAYSAPSVVRVGGLFNPFDAAGNLDVVQAENLAAFVMAVNELNDHSDGLWDDVLPQTRIEFAVRSAHGSQQASLAVYSLQNSFGGLGVSGIVGSLPNIETMASNRMAVDPKICQVHSFADETELGLGHDYPYKSQTVPIMSYEGMVSQAMMCQLFKAKKLLIFAGLDDTGVYATKEIQDGAYCDLEIMDTINIINPSITDFTEEIASAKKTGAKYFVFFLPPPQSAALLEQGTEAGLFDDTTQILSPFYARHSITEYLSPGADIASIMKGYISLEYWPEHTYLVNQAAKDFAQRWVAQPSTAGQLVGGNLVCDSTMDSEGIYYLYRSQTDASKCAGFDFGSYKGDGSDIAPYAALTYDAAITLFYGIDTLIREQKPIEGDALQLALMYNVTFEGVSGLVDIFEGMTLFNEYGRGDREVGQAYKIMNFQPDQFNPPLSNGFVQIGQWTSEEGAALCEHEGCYKPVLRTRNNKFPPDTPAPIVIDIPSTSAIVMFVFAALSFVAVLLVIALICYYNSSKLIKASQPIMLYFMCVGGLLSVARSLVGGTSISDVSCGLRNWFGHLAYVFVFGSLFVKTWRVNMLVNTRTLKKIKITNTDILKIMSACVFCACVYLAIMQGVGQPHLSHANSTISNQLTSVKFCHFEHSGFQTALFVVEFLVLLTGARLCWAVKNVPDSVNESKFIAGG